jgi:hypothetical protein
VRRVDWRRPQRPLDHGSNLIVVDGARAAGASFVKQAITAILQNRRRDLPTVCSWMPSSAATDLAWQAVRTSQDRATPLR